MGGGTDEGASMRYQHTNTSHQATSHNRSSGFSSVAEIAGRMGLRSPQPQQLALDYEERFQAFGDRGGVRRVRSLSEER